jgi:hypothetical protein
MAAIKARALVVGATTLAFYHKKYTEWDSSGFLRRFLWLVYKVKDPRVLEEAIHRWQLLPIDSIIRSKVPITDIKYNLTEDDSNFVLSLMREQPDRSGGFILLKKIACVLKWKYTTSKSPDAYKLILKDIGGTLRRDGGTLEL